MLRGERLAAAAAVFLCACRHAAPAAPRGAPDAATKAMAERLAGLSERYAPIRLFVNPHRIGLERARLAALPAPSFEDRLGFAQELLNAGESREALESLRALRREAPADREHALLSWLGIASLRLGEQQNCLMAHNAHSCLMPIRGSGVHAQKEGATAAIGYFSEALSLRPAELATRWLLNLAYMTAGDYPGSVPAKFLIPPSAFAPEAPFPAFPDRAREAGLGFTGHAGGAVTEDFRGVGLLDVMLSAQGLTDQIRYFRNEGDGTFTDRTRESGLLGITGGLSLIEADYDGDGRTDVLVLRGAWQMRGGDEPISLLHNDGGGRFSDVTEKAGLLGDYQSQAAAWADFDGDGRLDLLVCNEAFNGRRFPCRLFHGGPDGVFKDVTAGSGIAVNAVVKSVSVGDFDKDGRPDVFIATFGQGPILLHQRADGTFEDVTKKAGVGEPAVAFPSWFFDYDQDGWPDLLVFGFIDAGTTSLKELGYKALESVAADYLGLPFRDGRPKLYRNNRDGTFTDVAAVAGLNHALFAMGANFGDLDDDGYPDFYAGTGVPDLRGLMPNRLFRNDRGRRFLDVTSAADVGHVQKGHAVSFGDLNNDGYPDLLTVMGGAYEGDVFQRALFVNPGGANHWLALTLEGTNSNRSALGASIKIEARGPGGPRTVYGTVSSGGSFGCSGLRQTIGLGDANEVLSVEVRWPRPNGPVEHFTGAAAGRFWLLKEGTGAAVERPARRFAW